MIKNDFRMWKKYIFLFLLLTSSLLSQADQKNSKFQEFSTDRIQLETDMPMEFSKLFLEYSDGFSTIIYDFLSEIKEVNSPLKVKIKIFRNCNEYNAFLKDKKIYIKNSIFFREIQSITWSEFVIAGCYTNSLFFLRSFQHKLVESFLNDRNKEFPIWLKQGMLEYFENSYFFADDASIVPIIKQDYTLRLKKNTDKISQTQLSKLLQSEKKYWFDNSKFYYPYSWAFFKYLFDVDNNGRSILKKYINKLEYYPDKKINLPKSYENIFSFMGSRDTISIKNLENSFQDWIKNLPDPEGYSFYKSLENANVSSTRISLMENAIRENKNYYLYYKILAEEYYNLGKYSLALENAERALDLELKDIQNIKWVLLSSYKLEQYSKTEYYIWLAREFKMDFKELKSISEFIEKWRDNNKDIPIFLPEIKLSQF